MKLMVDCHHSNQRKLWESKKIQLIINYHYVKYLFKLISMHSMKMICHIAIEQIYKLLDNLVEINAHKVYMHATKKIMLEVHKEVHL